EVGEREGSGRRQLGGGGGGGCGGLVAIGGGGVLLLAAGEGGGDGDGQQQGLGLVAHGWLHWAGNPPILDPRRGSRGCRRSCREAASFPRFLVGHAVADVVDPPERGNDL